MISQPFLPRGLPTTGGPPTCQRYLALIRSAAEATLTNTTSAAHASRSSGGVLRENGIVTDEPAAQSRRCGQSANYLLSKISEGLPAFVFRRLQAVGKLDHFRGLSRCVAHVREHERGEMSCVTNYVSGATE